MEMKLTQKELLEYTRKLIPIKKIVKVQKRETGLTVCRETVRNRYREPMSMAR